MVTDQIVINRLMPESEGYFARWARTQAHYASEIRGFFEPVPVKSLPLFEDEVVGVERLARLGGALYGDEDPARGFVAERPYEFKKQDDLYTLILRLPFVGKGDIQLSRDDEDLVIRIGTFKRYVMLPRSISRLETAGARMENGNLYIRFVKEAHS